MRYTHRVPAYETFQGPPFHSDKHLYGIRDGRSVRGHISRVHFALSSDTTRRRNILISRRVSRASRTSGFSRFSADGYFLVSSSCVRKHRLLHLFLSLSPSLPLSLSLFISDKYDSLTWSFACLSREEESDSPGNVGTRECSPRWNFQSGREFLGVEKSCQMQHFQSVRVNSRQTGSSTTILAPDVPRIITRTAGRIDQDRSVFCT